MAEFAELGPPVLELDVALEGDVSGVVEGGVGGDIVLDGTVDLEAVNCVGVVRN